MAANTLKIVSLTSRVELVWEGAKQLSIKDTSASVNTDRKELLRIASWERIRQVSRVLVYERRKPERKSRADATEPGRL